MGIGRLGSLSQTKGAKNMDGSEFSKSAPSLDVFAPTSRQSTARFRDHQQARSGTAEKPRPKPGSLDTPNRWADHGGGVESGLAINRADSSDQTDQQNGGRTLLLANAFAGLPSWLVSLSVHLALLLILAVSSLGVGQGKKRLELELADSPVSFDVMATEIEFDDVVIEDEQELLEPDPTESLVARDVVVPLEILEQFTAQTEVEYQVETGFVNGLPGANSARSGHKGKSARFFGTRSYGSRFVFVIDCSLSMKGNRWYRAVRELNTAIEGLEKNQEFLVLLYNNRTSVMLNAKTSTAGLVVASRDNKDECRAWLRKQRPRGGTFPASAMFIALSLDPDAVFLLSDGELQDNTRELLQFWNNEQADFDEPSTKIPINTISLGRDSEGQEMMRSIAAQNEGEFTWIR